MAFMSTRCSCSPMRNTLQRRLSSRSSSGEYSCTVSTPFWSSSVPLGLGRSSERRTSGQSSQPGHAQLLEKRARIQFDTIIQTSQRPIFIGSLTSGSIGCHQWHICCFSFGFHAFCGNQHRQSLVNLWELLPAAYVAVDESTYANEVTLTATMSHIKMMINRLKHAKTPKK